MSLNQRREFSLREKEIIEVLMADNSDDEDCLLLDEADQTFLAQDLDAGVSTVKIEPCSTPHEQDVMQNQSPSAGARSFNWRKNRYLPHNFPEEQEYDFGKVLIADINRTSDEELTPVNIFDKVANFENLIDKIIVPESIRYAEQNGRSFTISNEEAKAFFGMNYVMSYHFLPTFRNYWSTDSDMGVPYIANVMTISRFEEIRRNLHFSDNSKEPRRTDINYDRAYKIRPVLEHFNRAFQSSMTNTKTQAIDKHMIKFKGHNIMRQYVKNKPIKWGFKLWCRADSSTGYLFQFDLYTGRKNSGPKTRLGESVVLQLCENLQGIGCELYFGNFFNSPNLQYKLKKLNIKACGTVRSNRKYMPKQVPADKNMKKGDIFTTSSNGISFIKWMDNKAVVLLTNFLSPIPTTTVKMRTRGSGEKMNVTCPEVVVKYNRNMGGVELMDHKKACYEVDRKAKIKYYLRLIFDMMDIAMNNSYIIYCKLHEAKRIEGSLISLLEFRQAVARSLVGRFTSRQRSLKSVVMTKKRIYLAYKHGTPSHIMKKVTNRKRCAQCAKKRVENRTYNTCSTCNVHLCYTSERNCFAEYH
ncbi:piggyBac transposable element-derived protein 4-like [Eurosta solidaginis]|uniref:piggyBac transposable element-derived protein 4-like n=1 Tax=Eurosta solidaginis TaxID=178769 RepID=UPI003530A0B6